MYIPKHFDVTDNEEIFSFVEENAFGQLISQVDGRLFSSHIPFLISKDKLLTACIFPKCLFRFFKERIVSNIK